MSKIPSALAILSPLTTHHFFSNHDAKLLLKSPITKNRALRRCKNLLRKYHFRVKKAKRSVYDAQRIFMQCLYIVYAVRKDGAGKDTI